MDDESTRTIIRAAKADAWDECAAAATGGGLTPLAEMLRADNPYRAAATRERTGVQTPEPMCPRCGDIELAWCGDWWYRCPNCQLLVVPDHPNPSRSNGSRS